MARRRSPRGSGVARRGDVVYASELASRAEGGHLERRPPLVAAGRAGRGIGESRARRGGASGDRRYDAPPLAGSAGAHRASPHPSVPGHRRPRPDAGARRRTGVLLGSSEALRDPSATLPVPWAETAVAAVAATAIGPIEIHCLHVPNAANGWVKPDTLKAVRPGWRSHRHRRASCAETSTPPAASSRVAKLSRSHETRAAAFGLSAEATGTRPSWASCPACGSSATETPIAPCTATNLASRAGPGSGSQVMPAAGASTTCSAPRNWNRSPVSTTTAGATRV